MDEKYFLWENILFFEKYFYFLRENISLGTEILSRFNFLFEKIFFFVEEYFPCAREISFLFGAPQGGPIAYGPSGLLALWARGHRGPIGAYWANARPLA